MAGIPRSFLHRWGTDSPVTSNGVEQTVVKSASYPSRSLAPGLMGISPAGWMLTPLSLVQDLQTPSPPAFGSAAQISAEETIPVPPPSKLYPDRTPTAGGEGEKVVASASGLNLPALQHALNAHGQSLTQRISEDPVLRTEVKGLKKNLDYSEYHRRVKGVDHSDYGSLDRRMRTRLVEFVARNARRIFVVPESVEGKEASEREAIEKLKSDYDEMFYALRRDHFFGSVTVGDVIIGQVDAYGPKGLRVLVRGFDPPRNDDVYDLNIIAVIARMQSLAELPAVERFAEDDLIRCEVTFVERCAKKVVLGIQGKHAPGHFISRYPLGIVKDGRSLTYWSNKLSSGVVNHADAFRENPVAKDFMGIENLMMKKFSLDPRAPLTYFSCVSSSVPSYSKKCALRERQGELFAGRHTKEGVRHLASGNFGAALKSLNESIEIYPTVEALLARGALYANQSQFEKATIDFRGVLLFQPDHADGRQYLVDTLAALARRCVEENRDQDALKAYEDLLEICPDDADAVRAVKRLKSERFSKLAIDPGAIRELLELVKKPAVGPATSGPSHPSPSAERYLEIHRESDVDFIVKGLDWTNSSAALESICRDFQGTSKTRRPDPAAFHVSFLVPVADTRAFADHLSRASGLPVRVPAEGILALPHLSKWRKSADGDEGTEATSSRSVDDVLRRMRFRGSLPRVPPAPPFSALGSEDPGLTEPRVAARPEEIDIVSDDDAEPAGTSDRGKEEEMTKRKGYARILDDVDKRKIAEYENLPDPDLLRRRRKMMKRLRAAVSLGDAAQCARRQLAVDCIDAVLKSRHTAFKIARIRHGLSGIPNYAMSASGGNGGAPEWTALPCSSLLSSAEALLERRRMAEADSRRGWMNPCSSGSKRGRMDGGGEGASSSGLAYEDV